MQLGWNGTRPPEPFDPFIRPLGRLYTPFRPFRWDVLLVVDPYRVTVPLETKGWGSALSFNRLFARMFAPNLEPTRRIATPDDTGLHSPCHRHEVVDAIDPMRGGRNWLLHPAQGPSR